MSNRARPLDEKVQVVAQVLDRINVAAAAHQVGVPESTLRYDLQKIRAALPAVLQNRPPGPQRVPQLTTTPGPPVRADRPAECPRCHSTHIWKNGGYWVLNWVLMLLAGWLGVCRVWIPRFRCAACGYEIPSAERQRQAAGRQAWWQQVQRLIGLSRFKLGLSARKTQVLVTFVYARQVSLGFIVQQTHRVGAKAAVALARLRDCRQAAARFLLYDETFPKLGRRAYRLGVAVCEHGLIRSVRCLRRKARDIPAQLRATVGGQFQPQYFLTDLEVTYGQALARAGLTLHHLRDLVHLIRQVIRLFDEAVRDVPLVHYPTPLTAGKRMKGCGQKRTGM